MDLPWWLGGIIIGLMVPAAYYFLNHPLGVSTAFGNLAKMLRPNTRLGYLRGKEFADAFNWRFYFICGIVLGGFVAARLNGWPWLTLELGRFTRALDWPFLFRILWLFGAGIIMGVGARIADGCTSGNGIHGVSARSPAGIGATISFVLAGLAITALLRAGLFGGL